MLVQSSTNMVYKILLIKFLFLSFTVLSADVASSGNYGRDIANSTRNHFSSDFSNTISKPLTSQNSSMETVDGTSSFNGANISCTSSTSGVFLKVSYTVIEPVHDLQVEVEFDRDVDGVNDINNIRYIDSSFTEILPVPISGVCADGVIACDPGTWGNCKFYQWEYTGSNIQLTESLRNAEELASCQCTNISCLSPSITQEDSVASVLGEGVFSQVFGANAGMVISDVHNSEAVIKYSGQNNESCINGSTPSSYSGTLESKGTQAMNDELTDSGSITSTLINSDYANNNSPIDGSSNFLNNNYGGEISTSEQASMSSRNSAIISSTSSSSGTSSEGVSYMDSRLNDSGVRVSEANSVSVIKRNDTSDLFCQVTWSKDGSAVFSTNENAQSTTTGLSEVTQMQTRRCENGVCPFNSASEAIKHDCGNVNNFGEVVARLSAVEEATKDMICSTK